jgi:hypothetical protein
VESDSTTNWAGVSAEAVESLHRFIALAPPDRFVVAAHFELGVITSHQGQPEVELQEFLTVANTFPESTSES